MRITLVKSKGDSHTLEPRATKPTLNRRLKFPPKVNVRTAHMPYAKVVNFLDMERFHEFLEGEFGLFDSRYIVLLNLKG